MGKRYEMNALTGDFDLVENLEEINAALERGILKSVDISGENMIFTFNTPDLAPVTVPLAHFATNLQGHAYIGLATPSTTPVTLKGNEKVFYVATEEGIYSNFGVGNISELSIIKSDNVSWKVDLCNVNFDGVSSSIKINNVIKAIYSSIKITKLRLFTSGTSLICQLRDSDNTLHASFPLNVGLNNIQPYNNSNISGYIYANDFNVSDFTAPIDGNIRPSAMDKSNILPFLNENTISKLGNKQFSGHIFADDPIVVIPKSFIKIPSNCFVVYEQHDHYNRIRVKSGNYTLPSSASDIVNIYVNLTSGDIEVSIGAPTQNKNQIIVGQIFQKNAMIFADRVELYGGEHTLIDWKNYAGTITSDIYRQYTNTFKRVKIYNEVGYDRTIRIANINKTSDIYANWTVLYIYNGNTLEKTYYLQPWKHCNVVNGVAKFFVKHNSMQIYIEFDSAGIDNDGILDFNPKLAFSANCYVDKNEISEYCGLRYLNMGASTSGMAWHSNAVIDLQMRWAAINMGGAVWKTYTDSKLNLNRNSWAGTHDNVMMNQVAQLCNDIDKNNNNKPDKIVIMCGLTDSQNLETLGTLEDALNFNLEGLTPSNWFDNITQDKLKTSVNIRACLQFIVDKLPDIQIILVTVQDCQTNTGYPTENIITVNRLIKDIADRFAIPYIDMFSCGISSVLGTANAGNMTSDGVHPNDKGMDLMRKFMRNKLKFTLLA